MKKILSLLGVVGLTATSTATVIACQETVELKALGTVLTTTTLGQFTGVPNEARILAKVKELHPNLDETQLEVSNITEVQATIKAKADSKKYSGSVTLTFTVVRTSLINIFSDPMIGEFMSQPTEAAIFGRLKEKYPDIDLIQLEIINLTQNGVSGTAMISAKVDSKDYFGKVMVLFNVIPAELNLLINQTDLGEFTPEELNNMANINANLISHLQELNPNID
jgi:hypothetical protein